MRVDMTPILTGRTDRIPFSFDWEEAPSYFPEVSFEGPVRVEGDVSVTSDCMRLSFHVNVSYRTECARCLKELHRSLSLDAVRDVAEKKTEESQNEEAVFVSDSSLFLDEPTAELLFLEMPARDLCSESCLGLCPRCGKNRNEGDCGCAAVKERDPRLEGLRKFLVDESEKS